MPKYDLITNARLKALVMASLSIQSLPEAEKVTLIERVAQLPEVGQQELIAVLEDEQQKMEAARPPLSPKQQEQLAENLRKISSIKKGMDRKMLVMEEKTEIANSDKAANELLKNL